MKICSLIPSGTEILFALGVGEQVAAVTQFCDYPEQAKTRPIVSRPRVDTSVLTSREAARVIESLLRSGQGTYVFDTDWLRREKPDLILTQDLCRVCDLESEKVIKAIADLHPAPQVLVLSPQNLSHILKNIRLVGEATGAEASASALAKRIEDRMGEIACKAEQASTRPRVFVLEWVEPLAAGGHWMPEMVELAGGSDQLGRPNEPSVLLAWEQVLRYDPEIIVMTPCSCPIERTLADVHVLAGLDGWSHLAAVRKGEVYIANSDYFVRPGPRVLLGLEFLAQLIHPEQFANLIPPGSVVKLDPGAYRGERSARNFGRHFRPYPS
ncbi:MAG TPA: ABC transporter substrate-binding protein [Acidobacteriota bacterium]|jgi:iron complex transport system substrate-binding protein